MSIMNLFRGGAPAQAPAPQPSATAAGQPAQPAQPSMDTPPAPVQPEGSQGNQNPLDAFKDLWKPPAEGEATDDFDPTSMFQINPETVQRAVSQMNFTGSLTPDLMQKIANGGEEAMQAMGQAMNSVAQQAFMQSMLGSAQLVQASMVKANEHLGRKMENQIKRSSVSTSLRKDNPVLNHPAASPIVSALEAQLTQKYPQASAEEITEKAREYLTKFGQSFAQPSSPATPSKEEMDWGNFLN